MSRVVGGLALILGLLIMPIRDAVAAPLTQDEVVVITYPSEGAVLSGEVPIQGTATHPSFNSYGILYAPGARVTGDTRWQEQSPIAWDVRTMVVNGVLGTWDTTQVPNGQYVLALVVYQSGSETPSLYFVNNLTIQNEEATPTPTPTATPEEGEEISPTEEAAPPPPAATVEQPPTATPRPTPTFSPEEGGAVDEGDEDGEGGLLPTDIFSVDAIKEAFTLGAQLAFLLYAVGILYVLAKAAIRYYLRQTKGKQSP
ncbi:MAG: hypothetical protein ACP5HS_00070 [Anaerolineae bacterium]